MEIRSLCASGSDMAKSRPMSQPFHFAFLVADLASTRRFYGEILGCREGRSAATWVDFDFFGNQISAHVGTPQAKSDHHGQVDGVAVPMPHFGAILDWRDFESLASRIKANDVAFIIEPYIRYAGEPGEQYTMFLRDLSGNPLEFKAFRNPSEVFSV